MRGTFDNFLRVCQKIGQPLVWTGACLQELTEPRPSDGAEIISQSENEKGAAGGDRGASLRGATARWDAPFEVH